MKKFFKISLVFVSVFVCCFSTLFTLRTANAQVIEGIYTNIYLQKTAYYEAVYNNSMLEDGCILPTFFTYYKTPDNESYTFDFYYTYANGFKVSNAYDIVTKSISTNTSSFVYTFSSTNPCAIYNGTVVSGLVQSVQVDFYTNLEYFLNYAIGTVKVQQVSNIGVQYVYYDTTAPTNDPLLTLTFLFNANYMVIDDSLDYQGAITTIYSYVDEQSNLSYNQGFIDGKLYAKDYYYQLGKEDGINSAHRYTFKNLIGAVIDVPINALKSLLNFNFLDVNILDFVLSILSFMLVLKVVGWFSGKS